MKHRHEPAVTVRDGVQRLLAKCRGCDQWVIWCVRGVNPTGYWRLDTVYRGPIGRYTVQPPEPAPTAEGER